MFVLARAIADCSGTAHAPLYQQGGGRKAGPAGVAAHGPLHHRYSTWALVPARQGWEGGKAGAAGRTPGRPRWRPECRRPPQPEDRRSLASAFQSMRGRLSSPLTCMPHLWLPPVPLLPWSLCTNETVLNPDSPVLLASRETGPRSTWATYDSRSVVLGCKGRLQTLYLPGLLSSLTTLFLTCVQFATNADPANREACLASTCAQWWSGFAHVQAMGVWSCYGWGVGPALCSVVAPSSWRASLAPSSICIPTLQCIAPCVHRPLQLCTRG